MLILFMTVRQAGNDGFTGLGDEEVTLTDTTVSASVLKDAYENGTSGTIDASSVHTISGTGTTITNANAVYASGRFTGLGSENVTITDQGSLEAMVMEYLSQI